MCFKATLVLCGSAKGVASNFARNQVFLLEGFASRLSVTKKFNLKSKLYQVIERQLSIALPHQVKYEIWMTQDAPSDPSELNPTRWSELRSRKIPRRLFINQSHLKPEEGSKSAKLPITLVCLSPKLKSFWLIFKSDMSEFIVQVRTQLFHIVLTL